MASCFGFHREARAAQHVRLDDLMITVAGITAESARLVRENEELKRQVELQSRALECLRDEHAKTQTVLHETHERSRRYRKECRAQRRQLRAIVHDTLATNTAVATVTATQRLPPSPPALPGDDTESESCNNHNGFASAEYARATKS